MANSQESKKCFCARCFLPVDADDKVEIEGQHFHKLCSMCCICRTIPTNLKMFYGHVFCNECFKTHVMSRFRGDSPRIHSNSWWMQWAPGTKPQEEKDSTSSNTSESKSTDEAPKRCICARCLQPVDKDKVVIDDQSFHGQCAKCYFCRTVPEKNVKIYYGQVFCEECFHRHVMSKNRDNPSEFFRNCFEQWQNSAQFADNMREFMVLSSLRQNFTATTPALSIAEDAWDLSFENRTEESDNPESCVVDESAKRKKKSATVAEKVEKLTKYLHEQYDIEVKSADKKWKIYEMDDISNDSVSCWRDLQSPDVKSCKSNCPKCLWQCGPIYVNSEYLQKKQIVCEDE